MHLLLTSVYHCDDFEIFIEWKSNWKDSLQSNKKICQNNKLWIFTAGLMLAFNCQAEGGNFLFAKKSQLSLVLQSREMQGLGTEHHVLLQLNLAWNNTEPSFQLPSAWAQTLVSGWKFLPTFELAIQLPKGRFGVSSIYCPQGREAPGCLLSLPIKSPAVLPTSMQGNQWTLPLLCAASMRLSEQAPRREGHMLALSH